MSEYQVETAIRALCTEANKCKDPVRLYQIVRDLRELGAWDQADEYLQKARKLENEMVVTA